MGVTCGAGVVADVNRVLANDTVAAPAQRKGDKIACARACGSGKDEMSLTRRSE